MATLTDFQLRELMGELRAAMDELEFGPTLDGSTLRGPNLEELLRRMAAARSDGFKRRSMGGGEAQTIRDENGDPMPPVSDPTGEVAANEVKVLDPIRVKGVLVFSNLLGALGQFRVARGALIEAFKGQAGDGDPGCKCHGSIGRFEEVHRAERCRWCYDFWLTEGVDPPAELLKARAAGKRISDAMVREALGTKGRKVSVGSLRQ